MKYKRSNKQRDIKIKVNQLDPDYYYRLYFDYYLLQNIYHSPLLIFIKVLDLFTSKKTVDHVCHISRFLKDGDGQVAKIFEANSSNGMREFGLLEKLLGVKGKVWIEKVGKVDKKKAKKFEKEFLGKPYSKSGAASSGIDLSILGLDKFLRNKTDGLFCSYLEALFSVQQGFDIKPPLEEYTPTDVWHLNTGVKELFFDSNNYS